MSMTVDELIAIKDLPDFLRSDHCYNDLQHAMLVILFRHALTALRGGNRNFADTIIDNITMYLFIHFLNEEEGLAFKVKQEILDRDSLAEHSEMHVQFLDFWRSNIMLPYKKEEVSNDEALERLSKFYNLIIRHIDDEDVPTYGSESIEAEWTRRELARIGQAGMAMSPFMAGAYQTVCTIDKNVASMVNQRRISPRALESLGTLDLIAGIGRVLPGSVGSLRDRFVQATRGDQNPNSVCFRKSAQRPQVADLHIPTGFGQTRVA